MIINVYTSTCIVFSFDVVTERVRDEKGRIFRNFPFLFVFSGFPFEHVRAKKKLDQNSKKKNEKKTKSHILHILNN